MAKHSVLSQGVNLPARRVGKEPERSWVCGVGAKPTSCGPLKAATWENRQSPSTSEPCDGRLESSREALTSCPESRDGAGDTGPSDCPICVWPNKEGTGLAGCEGGGEHEKQPVAGCLGGWIGSLLSPPPLLGRGQVQYILGLVRVGLS